MESKDYSGFTIRVKGEIVVKSQKHYAQGWICKSTATEIDEDNVKFEYDPNTHTVISDLILGAVGVLQFEVVASRLMNEYGVDAVFEGTSISSARWVSGDDKKMLSEFEKALAHNVAYDAAGNLTYLATSAVNLRLTEERWPKLTFHATREHSVSLGG